MSQILASASAVAKAAAASLAAFALLAGIAPGCSSSQQTPRTQQTNAEVMTAGSPDVRTVDNTGYVGPAGNTRSVSQGMGSSTIGRSEGVPPPQGEGGGASSATTTTPLPEPSTAMSSSAFAAAIERAARAACDRETSCNHVGPNRTYASAETCMSDKRTRIEKSGPVTSCPNTISDDRLRLCLAAIRAVECPPPGKLVPPPPECTRASLCAR